MRKDRKKLIKQAKFQNNLVDLFSDFPFQMSVK